MFEMSEEELSSWKSGNTFSWAVVSLSQVCFVFSTIVGSSFKRACLGPDWPSVCACLVTQSCPTLCDPMDCSPPGSSVHGILQARKLEWVAISFSNGWKWKVKGKSLSHVRLSGTPWTAAYQAPQSMGFSRQEYWSGCHRLLPSFH